MGEVQENKSKEPCVFPLIYGICAMPNSQGPPFPCKGHISGWPINIPMHDSYWCVVLEMHVGAHLERSYARRSGQSALCVWTILHILGQIWFSEKKVYRVKTHGRESIWNAILFTKTYLTVYHVKPLLKCMGKKSRSEFRGMFFPPGIESCSWVFKWWTMR